MIEIDEITGFEDLIRVFQFRTQVVLIPVDPCPGDPIPAEGLSLTIRKEYICRLFIDFGNDGSGQVSGLREFA